MRCHRMLKSRESVDEGWQLENWRYCWRLVGQRYMSRKYDPTVKLDRTSLLLVAFQNEGLVKFLT